MIDTVPGVLPVADVSTPAIAPSIISPLREGSASAKAASKLVDVIVSSPYP